MIVGKSRTENHVVERGVVSVVPNARQLDASERHRIMLWLDLNQVAQSVDLQSVTFENAAPHSGALPFLVADIGARFGAAELAILYLHRGHQLDTRSPILQHLLSVLGPCGPVFALRVDDEAARRDAGTMARAILHCHGKVLVLTDETRRLGPNEAAPPLISYTVLLKEGVGSEPVMASPEQAVVENLEVHP